MSADARVALKAAEAVMRDAARRLVALRPQAEAVEPVELRRISLRGVVMLVGIGVAGYIVLPQFAQVDFGNVIAPPTGAGRSARSSAPSSPSPAPRSPSTARSRSTCSFVRTYMTQLAVAFSGLVAPAAVGNIALNTRYLQTSGLPRPSRGPASASPRWPSSAPTSSCSHLGCARRHRAARVVHPAGRSSSSVIPIAVILLLGLLAVPRVRALLTDRGPPADQVRDAAGPRGVPAPGQAGPAASAAPCCSTRASSPPSSVRRGPSGRETSSPPIAVVYFAGAIIGSAVPTPGGLGGIEAAMSSGLIAIGVDSGTAVSSVLLYRLATYWLPIPFGWFSLNRLQKVGAI